jgi:hypothetical protein
MSTSAKFQIMVPDKDAYGEVLSRKFYYVNVVADGVNCAANDIEVELVTETTQFEEGDTAVLPTSGVMPPEDPPTALKLVAN